MAELQTFSFDNEDIKSGLFEKYKGTKNQVDRVGIIYKDPKAMFAGSKTHFKERYFLCKKGKCCEILGPAKWRVGAVIIKYGTDKQGGLKKPFSYELFPWIFSEGTYTKMKNLNNEFPLATHDIKISCSNEDYQSLDITPCSEVIWTAKDELKTAVLEQATPYWESIKRSIASDLSVEEINELLGAGGGTGSTAMDPSTSIDLDSVLNKI
jgi:hypothetical protein